MNKFKEIALFALFVFLFANKVNAISNDSLLTSVKNLPDDTIKVIELYELSERFLRYQIDTSFIITELAIKLSKKLNYTRGYAYALKQMGLVYKNMSKYDSSLLYYDKSLQVFYELKIDSERASLLNRMANVYKRKGQFDKSLESFYQALEIAENNNDSILITAVHNNLGVLYYDLGDFDKALQYYNLRLEYFKKNPQTKGIHVIYMNIANVYDKQGYLIKALEFYQLSLENLHDKKNRYDRLFLLHNLGTSYEKLGKLIEAKDHYLKALSIGKEINEKELRVFSLQGLGNVTIKLGYFNEGIKYLEDSYNLASAIQDIRKEHELSSTLYKAYEKKEMYKESFSYLKTYVKIEDSIFQIDKRTKLVELEQKYSAEKREQQIAFLEKEQEIHKLELSKKTIEAKQKSFQRNGLFFAIILAVLFAFYFGIESKKRKRINQILVKQNKKIGDQRIEIALQNNKLVESNKTKDKLFQIIAHDLRSPLISIDSITQLIPYWVEEQDYDSLMRLSKTLELSVNNVLSLVDNLLNWALSQQGKFPYQPENFNLKDNILEAVNVYKPIAQFKLIKLKLVLNQNISVFADRNMLFTVVRNLLNNAVKFTPESGEIEVGIDSNQHFAKVWVKDSGVGIPEEKKELVFEFANGNSKGTLGETGKGLGLFFCKEFVQINNGEIFIESSSGKGTTISFTLPLFNIPEN